MSSWEFKMGKLRRTITLDMDVWEKLYDLKKKHKNYSDLLRHILKRFKETEVDKKE